MPIFFPDPEQSLGDLGDQDPSQGREETNLPHGDSAVACRSSDSTKRESPQPDGILSPKAQDNEATSDVGAGPPPVTSTGNRSVRSLFDNEDDRGASDPPPMADDLFDF